MVSAIAALAMLVLGTNTALFAAEQQGRDNPKPIALPELKAAVQRGEKIVGRVIRGEDIVAALAPHLTTEKRCSTAGALNIEKSVIQGDVALQSQSTPAPPNDESDDTENEESHLPARWLSVPMLITDTEISNRLAVASIGIACKMDLSRSTFEDRVDLLGSIFATDLAASGSVFKGGLEVQGTEFAAADFRLTKFMGNVGFTPISRRTSIFNGNADFRAATFGRHASFLQTEFLQRMDFRDAQFIGGSSFSNARLGSNGILGFGGPFFGTEFGGPAVFRNARIANLRFWRTRFRDGADFQGVRGDRLSVLGVTVMGPLSFDGARIKQLEFSSFGGSMVVEGETVFRRAIFDQFKCSWVTFKKTVDFEGARVESNFSIRTVSFEGDLRLEDGLLPGAEEEDDESGEEAKPKITVEDITLNKGLYIDADQFLIRSPWWAFWREDTPRFYSGHQAEQDRRVWRELRRAFDIAKNVELKNYAEYELRLSDETKREGIARIPSVASRWFWGYGLRPVRVVLWLALVLLVFAGIYWTQIPEVAATANPISRKVTRAKQAMMFSARTAWELKYGYEHSATSAFQMTTLAESILAKILLACFAYALTQTSPLLSDLMKKLLP